ncbi:MAG: outer membrane beta-barrel protein [Rickettsiales bacterium]
MIKTIIKTALITSCLASMAAASAGGHATKKNDPWGVKFGYVHTNLNNHFRYDSSSDAGASNSNRNTGHESLNGVLLGVDYRVDCKDHLFYGFELLASKGFSDKEFENYDSAKDRYQIINQFSLRPSVVVGSRFDRMNLYAKFGVNASRNKIEREGWAANTLTRFYKTDETKMFYGPSIGVGTEVDFGKNLVAFAEYNYSYLLKTKLKNVTYTNGDGDVVTYANTKIKLDDNSFMLGLKYSF